MALITLFLCSALVAGLFVRALHAAGSASDKNDPIDTPMKTAAPNVADDAVSYTLYSRSGHDITPLPQSRIDELAKKLSPDDAKVILAKGTERAFCGNLLDNKLDGTYVCKLCGLPLFASAHKFDSGTGWPSFFQPFDKAHVREERDTSYGMVRTEILCRRCTAHLGHVFDDGPQPTGMRFCLNSASLTFVEKGQPLPPESRPVEAKTAYFGGGCFWGVEDWFQRTPGVIDAESGYMGGDVISPTYRQVCSDTTGHAEVVRITFDPKRVSYTELLKQFFRIHDPTQLNRQGPDEGTQYRSSIFAADEEQLTQAKQFIAEQQTKPRFASRKIVTQVEPVRGGAAQYWPAEEYHQDYNERTGHVCPRPMDVE